jgi:nicotinamide mononucleotide transporter
MVWNVLEAVAALGNLAYTVLMLKERRTGWLFGIAASALGVVLFWHERVYAQAGLSLFYVAMGAYGWWQWGQGNGAQELPITRRGPLFHLFIALAGGLLAMLLAAGAYQLPDARHVELEAGITAFSVLATWMLARKVLENWAWWIATDLAAIVLYMLLGLWWYAGLYAIYVGLSVAALVRWTRVWRASLQAAGGSP